MSTDADRFRDALIEGAREIGLSLGSSVSDALVRHYVLLIKWNAKMNLTAVTDPVEAAHLHGLDSLLFAELVSEGEALQTVDVGSGAGFPGIPLALARPRLSVTLLEPIRKRASFLRVALAELRLPGVRVVEGKLDEGAGPSRLWPADLVVSRATIAPIELAGLVCGKLAPGGRLIVTSGASAPTIAAFAATGLRHLERLERRLPKEQVRILDVLTA